MISTHTIVQAVNAINAMSSKQKEALLDEIHEHQPTMLGDVVTLARLGVSRQVHGHVFHMLLVFYNCFSDNGKIKLPVITEAVIVAARNKNMKMMEFLSGGSEDQMVHDTKLFIDGYPERNLLAYFTGYFRDNGLAFPSDENNEAALTTMTMLDVFCGL